jgi:hypothetical protein
MIGRYHFGELGCEVVNTIIIKKEVPGYGINLTDSRGGLFTVPEAFKLLKVNAGGRWLMGLSL